MAAVKWDTISGLIDEAFSARGRIERSYVLALAEADNADDDVIDALDAIGSRLFQKPDDVRDFLIAEGYVVS